MKRIPFTIPSIAYHFTIYFVMRRAHLSIQSTILLHSIQPLMQLLFRSPYLFWKERLDYTVRGLDLKYLKSTVFITLIWICSFLFLGHRFRDGVFFLAGLGPLILFQHYTLPYWLGKKKHSPPTTAIKSLQFNRGFWSKSKKNLARNELNAIGIENWQWGRSLLVSNTTSDEVLKSWGRGWLRDISTRRIEPQGHREILATEYGYDLNSLNWIKPIPPELNLLAPIHAFELMKLILRSEGTSGKGTFRLAELRLRWTRTQDLFILRILNHSQIVSESNLSLPNVDE